MGNESLVKDILVNSISVHDYDTGRLLRSKPQKMLLRYHPKNKIHWPVKKKKSERPKYPMDRRQPGHMFVLR